MRNGPRRWTPAVTEQALDMRLSGMSYESIALAMSVDGRSVSGTGVRTRLQQLSAIRDMEDTKPGPPKGTRSGVPTTAHQGRCRPFEYKVSDRLPKESSDAKRRVAITAADAKFARLMGGRVYDTMRFYPVRSLAPR